MGADILLVPMLYCSQQITKKYHALGFLTTRKIVVGIRVRQLNAHSLLPQPRTPACKNGG